MAANAGADGRRVAICPACGYPRLGAGLCAACIQTSAAALADQTMNTIAVVSQFNPAA